ncbi:hypothetical protein [Sinomonas sp.]|uniref:hypothetical protein n=1 Tax=Sinomonas sp. TaxID=1914986 RepID=UPI002FE060A8
MLAKFTLPALTLIGTLVVTSVVLAAVVAEGTWFSWTIASFTALLLAVVAATARFSPRNAARRMGVGFFLVGLGGALFLSSSGLPMPASLPTWGWTILAIGMATIGLVEDADRAQSTPKNRL